MIAPIERALGVSALRYSDNDICWSADDVYDYEAQDGQPLSVFAIEPLTPGYWQVDAPIPTGAEATRYRVALNLDYRQLMQLIKAIAPGKKVVSESPERQGELTIGSFIAEQLVREEGTKAKAGDVYAAYAAWCRSNRLDAVPFTHNAWGEAIAAAGIEKHRHKTGYQYLGVRINAEAHARGEAASQEERK